MSELIRLALLLGVLALFIVLVAAHGVIRAFVIVMAVALILTAPRTQAWQVGERWLVRLTGSRRRAAVLVMVLVIGVMAAVNLYNLTH
jgi:phosphatidylglycerophosphate synthase